MKNKKLCQNLFLAAAVLLLAFGLSTCSGLFLGSNLKDTKWVVSEDVTNENFEWPAGSGPRSVSYTQTLTLEFTSDTEAKLTSSASKFSSNMVQEDKDKVNGGYNMLFALMTITYTYSNSSGTITFTALGSSSEAVPFTVDKAKKTLSLGASDALGGDALVFKKK